MTRLERIVEQIGKELPELTQWHMERFARFSDKGPFKMLIQMVISHQTTITIEDKAIEKLWTRFQTPLQFADARFEDVDELIKNVNYHPTKARRIIEISRLIGEKWGGSLNFLADLTPERALEELTSLPGVGRKSAGMVLLAIFKKPIMPVDTNVLRSAKELGLVEKNDAPDTVSKKLEVMLPAGDRDAIVKAHNYLLSLGQATARGKRRDLLDQLRAIK